MIDLAELEAKARAATQGSGMFLKISAKTRLGAIGIELGHSI